MRGVDLEPIERLEGKVQRLVDAMVALKQEHAGVLDENRRLTREVEALSAKIAEAEGTSLELTALRDERDQIKQRVSSLIDQLDGLDL